MNLLMADQRLLLADKLCHQDGSDSPLPFVIPLRINTCFLFPSPGSVRSEEHTSELQSRFDLVCRLLLFFFPFISTLFPYTTLFRSHFHCFSVKWDLILFQ